MPKSRHRKKGRSRPKGMQSRSAVALMKAAARLPLQLCVISSDWREELYATVICARQGSGLIAASAFMADLGCLGIKHALGPGL